jgi:hypothetical protein
MNWYAVKKESPHGAYVVDEYDEDNNLVATVRAAPGSPMAQSIRLFDRLFKLADKLAGYNE